MNYFPKCVLTADNTFELVNSSVTKLKPFLVICFIVSLHRTLTSTLPTVNLPKPKVPNLTVAGFSPANWMTANSDLACVSAMCCLTHTQTHVLSMNMVSYDIKEASFI